MAYIRPALLFSLALVACGGSSDDTGGDTGSTTDATGSATNPTTTMSTTMSSATDTSMSSSESGGSTTSPDDTGSSTADSGPADSSGSSGIADGSGSSSGGGMSVCDPVNGDSDCVACTKMSCCGQLQGCLNNADCALVYNCLDGINQPSIEEQMTCATDNGVDFNSISAFIQQIFQCRMGACPADCPA